MQIEFIFSILIYFLACLVTRSCIYRYRIVLYAILALVFGLWLRDLDAHGFLNIFHRIKRRWSISIKTERGSVAGPDFISLISNFLFFFFHFIKNLFWRYFKYEHSLSPTVSFSCITMLQSIIQTTWFQWTII
jgi:hypothetical protein